jgi:Ca-activated chloride channel family protein
MMGGSKLSSFCRVVAACFFVALAVAPLATGCGSGPPAEKLAPRSETTTELRAIRRGVTVTHPGADKRAPYAKERLGVGATVDIDAGGLAWVRRDGGTTLLVHGPGSLKVEQDGLRLVEGRAFAEAPEGVTESLVVPEGPLVLSAVRASLEVRGGKTSAYVLDGEVRSGGAVAGAGERLDFGGGKGTVTPALAWEDWTGGLATTDPTSAPAPFGVGTVGARTPGASGAPRAPLTIQRLDVRVKIDGDFAITEVDQTFFNPLSDTVEGIYKVRVPDGALLERFGVDRDGGILYGYVKEKKQAEAQYQAHVYEGSTEDPALLAWTAPGVYEARLYPIGPGATRRVVVRYTEWLNRSGAKGERRLYFYPMAAEGSEASAPHIDDLSIEIDLEHAGAREIRSGMGAVRVGDTLVIRAHDLIPRADLAVELFDEGPKKLQAIRARHLPDLGALGPEEQSDARRRGDGETDYLLVPIRATDVPAREPGLDLVIVVDASAATDASMLRLARATTRALLAHVGDKDRVLVLAGDDRVRPVLGGENGELGKVDAARTAEILEALAAIEPGGATDLAAMLGDATTKLSGDRASAIVYVGDGAPTVGEADLAAIRDKLKKSSKPVRLFSLGIGDGANMALLAGLSTGGFAERIGDERAAAKSALRLLEVAERAVELGATVDLGSNVERAYPRELGGLVDGDTALVVGRVSGDSPTQVTLHTGHGDKTLELDVKTLDDRGDLRRRWAMGRLDEMLSGDTGRAAVVDLGVRQGIITPYTSLYVPTSKEMTPDQRRQIDRKPRVRTVVPARNERDGRDEDEEQKNEKADADNKEGGTGTRAKGEEGKMGDKGVLDGLLKSKDKAEATTAPAEAKPIAAAPAAPPAAQGVAPEPQAAATATAALEAPKPSAGEDLPQKEIAAPSDGKRRADDAPPRGPSGNTVADPNQVPTPDLVERDYQEAPGGGGQGFGAGSGRLGGMHATPRENHAGKVSQNAWGGDIDGEAFGDESKKRSEAAEFGMIGLLDSRSSVIIVVDNPGRIIRKCGAGADLPFEERKALWRERLSAAGGRPAEIAKVYRRALALCEAPTQRERRALLLLGVDALPSVSARVQLYRVLVKDVGAADIVYRAILARVTTPDQVRELNASLGLATVDSLTLEKTIKEAKTPAELVAKLRGLASRFPDDLALGLRLLDALEDAGDDAGARGLARALRKRNDADARVRTAVGELHLRLSARAPDDAAKRADEAEAKRAFGEIVEFSPDDPVARRRLGDLYRAHGYFAEATRQYETLARLVPDDPTVSLLLAACANGQGKLEEAVRWTEKGGQAGAPDAAQGPHATARAFAMTFLAWGRMDARAAGKKDELTALFGRLDRVLGSKADRKEGEARVVLTWSHPELHPTLWTNALGSMMPAPEGDVTLGIAQAALPDRPGGMAEVRLEPADVEAAARLGAKATLTVVFGEGKDTEVIQKQDVAFQRGGPATLRFTIENGKVEVSP